MLKGLYYLPVTQWKIKSYQWKIKGHCVKYFQCERVKSEASPELNSCEKREVD